MAVNRVEFGNQILMDITDTSATPPSVIEGQIFYQANGERSIGTLGVATVNTDGLMSMVDKAKLDGINVECKTTADWNNNYRQFIPEAGAIIIYSDHGTLTDESTGNVINVPDIKIGDGLAYCIDLPFIKQDICDSIIRRLDDHINNTTIHTSAAEKTFWNNKLNYDIADEELIFNRN